ncbi:MAG: AEC family transporter [Desulfosoma sp.]|uniref:AEC family transporter n=1 Tax=Desulfosoma sp. TaxID=2603217 RepID=UPI00404AC9ED
MLKVFVTHILPVFSIIGLGYVLMHRRFVENIFIASANRLVYYVAVPAMLFHEVARSSFSENFDGIAVVSMLAGLGVVTAIGFCLAHLTHRPASFKATFVHSTFHGNLGYMAYAIAFYALGEKSFAQTAILSSFLIVAQNLLAVCVFAYYKPKNPASFGHDRFDFLETLKRVATNPIIVSVTAGTVFSYLSLSLHPAISQSLKILSGMALPLALLLIGTSLSFHAFTKLLPAMSVIGLLKLFLFPLIAYGLMHWWHVPAAFHTPVLILTAAPPATVTYIMALELGGDTQLAAAATSLLTLVSGWTYALLLSFHG